MLANVVLAVSLAIGTTPWPSPAPTALKVIVTVKSSLLCTTLRDNVARAVDGLRVNDKIIDQGRTLLEKTAHDSLATGTTPHGGFKGSTTRNPAMTMDSYQLGVIGATLAKNLGKIDELLNDNNRFVSNPTAEDQRQLAVAKSQLEAVEAHQKVALNVIYGTADTMELQDLLSRGDGMSGALGQTSVNDQPVDLTKDPIDARASPPTASLISAPEGSLFAQTVYGRLALSTAIVQHDVGDAEDILTPTILTITTECK